jgi:glycosyltransferase involved in cell wall biosynthesis
METNLSKISIITVVYNGVDLLEDTIRSVVGQTYPNIEYLIIDGASNDGTLDIIKKYDDLIDQWISEPDNGLYDAMNKGIKLATGDYLWFMNSGDHIHEPTTVQRMMDRNTNNADIIYGEVLLVDSNRHPLGTRSELSTRKLPKQLHWKSLKHGMVVSHQAFLPKRSIAPLYIEHNLAADIDWVIECLKKSKRNLNTEMVLAKFLLGGVSKQRHQQSLKDRFAVLQKHYGLFPNLWNHFYIGLRAIWHKLTASQTNS